MDVDVIYICAWIYGCVGGSICVIHCMYLSMQIWEWYSMCIFAYVGGYMYMYYTNIYIRFGCMFEGTRMILLDMDREYLLETFVHSNPHCNARFCQERRISIPHNASNSHRSVVYPYPIPTIWDKGRHVCRGGTYVLVRVRLYEWMDV